jgi:hypothetical protein
LLMRLAWKRILPIALGFLEVSLLIIFI